MLVLDEFSNEDLQKRYKIYYGDKNKTGISKGQIPFYRNKWVNLSEYVREIKQSFSNEIIRNRERLEYYRKYVYEKAGLIKGKNKKEPDLTAIDRFKYRTRYFSDSGIIGTKEFVNRLYQQFKNYFGSRHEKEPITIRGLEGIYSLKRLSETV